MSLTIRQTISGLILFSAVLLALAGYLRVDFNKRMDLADEPPSAAARTAIVFTGQFSRIDRALDLFRNGRVDRIFISGVNAGAGLKPDRFPDQFGLDDDLRAALADGQITLGTAAQNTLQNALETSCWLASHPAPLVTLISSRNHIPRASLALERATKGGVSVSTAIPDESTDNATSRPLEFLKFAGTWLITRLPPHFWPGTNGIQACKRA